MGPLMWINILLPTRLKKTDNVIDSPENSR